MLGDKLSIGGETARRGKFTRECRALEATRKTLRLNIYPPAHGSVRLFLYPAHFPAFKTGM
jgi:hypothetical protein